MSLSISFCRVADLPGVSRARGRGRGPEPEPEAAAGGEAPGMPAVSLPASIALKVWLSSIFGEWDSLGVQGTESKQIRKFGERVLMLKTTGAVS